MNILQKILVRIGDSVKSNNDVSSTRVSSYLVLAPIILMVLVFLAIEICAFGHAVRHGQEYKLSNEIIVVFGMMLSHHLAILFSRTKSQSIEEIKGTEKTTNTETTNTETTNTETTNTETTETGK